MAKEVLIVLPETEYSDEELDSECRLVGSLMLDPSLCFSPLAGLNHWSFCVPFHGAAYFAIQLLMAKGVSPTPARVWELIKDHPTAEDFGLAQLVDLATDAAAPDNYINDNNAVVMRGFRLGAKALRDAGGSVH